jgi:hypothetical protein
MSRIKVLGKERPDRLDDLQDVDNWGGEQPDVESDCYQPDDETEGWFNDDDGDPISYGERPTEVLGYEWIEELGD